MAQIRFDKIYRPSQLSLGVGDGSAILDVITNEGERIGVVLSGEDLFAIAGIIQKTLEDNPKLSGEGPRN